MSEHFESGSFLYQLPVFLVGFEDGQSQGFVKCDGQAGETATVLFTDQDLAERFVESLPPLKPGQVYAIKIVPDICSFIGFLVVMQHKGYTHVVADPSKTQAVVRTISSIIADAARCYD